MNLLTRPVVGTSMTKRVGWLQCSRVGTTSVEARRGEILVPAGAGLIAGWETAPRRLAVVHHPRGMRNTSLRLRSCHPYTNVTRFVYKMKELFVGFKSVYTLHVCRTCFQCQQGLLEMKRKYGKEWSKQRGGIKTFLRVYTSIKTFKRIQRQQNR